MPAYKRIIEMAGGSCIAIQTHPAYRFFAERIIRRLMEAVKGYRCVIGFQLDNETKHFGTSSENVQQMFVRYIRKNMMEIWNASIMTSALLTGATASIPGKNFPA